MDAESLRAELVSKLRQDGSLTDPLVAAAMAAVPRHVFVPEVAAERAYSDVALVTKQDESGTPTSSASQPAIVAIMLEQLALSPGLRVLEIGAGTGYNAALLAHLVGPSGRVTTVDIAADVVERARRGLDAAGYPAVRVLCGDGGRGAPDGAPYDRIIATVGAWDIPPEWVAQLAPDGILVLPLGIRGVQRSVAFVHDAGLLRSTSVVPCGFMPMQGPFAGPSKSTVVSTSPPLSVRVDDGRDLDVAGLAASLAAAPVVREVPMAATGRELFESVDPWMALGSADYCRLRSEAAGFWFGMTVGLVEGASLAYLLFPGAPEEWERSVGAEPVKLELHAYGPFGTSLADRLAAMLAAWDAAGRPGTDRMRIAAYPAGTPDSELAGRLVVDKVHTRLALTRP